ncbi:7813_t:CDS:1, partial [Racocetra fulgida]
DKILDRIFSLIHHLPDDINTVQNRIKRQQQQMKERHDSKLQRITQFEIGDRVLVYNMKQHVTHGNKFQSQWSTEWFYIHETLGNGAYKLRNQHDQLLRKTFN